MAREEVAKDISAMSQETRELSSSTHGSFILCRYFISGGRPIIYFYISVSGGCPNASKAGMLFMEI